MKVRVWSILVLFLSISVAGLADPPKKKKLDIRKFNWEEAFNEDFTRDHKDFEGKWESNAKWEGKVCDGYYEYVTELTGKIEKVKFHLGDGDEIDVFADLRDIEVKVSGKTRCDATFCAEVAGTYRAKLKKAILKADVRLKDNGEDVPEVSISIRETTLEGLSLADELPGWLETFIEKKTNETLSKVWKSKLGARISHRLSESMKQEPKPEQPKQDPPKGP